MPLTPKDIEQQTFRASFRGYAEDEVDMFLEEVILSVGEYQQMVRDREARLADHGSPVGEGADAARQEASAIIAAARAEADAIIAKAREEADQLVAVARADADTAASSGDPSSVPDALSAAQMADRERLLVGYQGLKDELSGVRARLRRALSASEEAFGIVEGQVTGIIEAAVPDGELELELEREPVGEPEPELEPEPVGEPEPERELGLESVEERELEPVEESDPESEVDVDVDQKDDTSEEEQVSFEVEDDALGPPRRPWER